MLCEVLCEGVCALNIVCVANIASKVGMCRAAVVVSPCMCRSMYMFGCCCVRPRGLKFEL